MLISSSAIDSFAVTPSDSTDISCEALYVGGGGAIAIKHVSTGATITYSGIPAGTIIPVKLRNGRVMAASTASLIIAMQV
jgi:hypothetical protein